MCIGCYSSIADRYAISFGLSQFAVLSRRLFRISVACPTQPFLFFFSITIFNFTAPSLCTSPPFQPPLAHSTSPATSHTLANRISQKAFPIGTSYWMRLNIRSAKLRADDIIISVVVQGSFRARNGVDHELTRESNEAYTGIVTQKK